MKPIKSFLHIMLLLITVSFTAPVFSQSSQYALYNYRNDGNFNAWLNLDIEKITYSCIDTQGVEHDDIVVQEVWTADSVYRIPLEAIDSIGFRAPAPVMREGIFYLDEYHAAHTLEIDSLTLYFDTSIDRDRLPSLGQVVLHNTFTTPYEEGFAGRVKTIEEVNGRIKIDCEMLCVGDVYKHLVLVGSAQTMTDEEADVASARTRGDGDPWIKYEEAGEMPIRKIGDLTFTIFDGLISVVSKDPTLQVKYMVYVDEDIYHISANCQLTHNNLQYGVNLNLGKLCEIDDTIKVDKELKEITQALKRLQDYKEMSADEWVESFLNEKIQKGNKEKLSDDETKVLGGLWDKLHGSWTIPIGGPFVLDLELGPLFKPKGSLELSFMAKTKARNTFYVEARGYTMATLANPRLALATGLAHIDGYSNFHSEPISSLSLSAKAKASLSIGIIGKVSVSLIHKSIVHATVSGQGGLKLGGSLEAKWDSESWYDEDYSFDNFYDYFDPLYDALKDTKIKAELFANFGVELGLTPWSFLSVGAEWEAYNNELGSCYLFPHFSKPSFPVYYHDKEQWSNGNFNNHLTLQSLPTKNIPDLLLGPCNIGMRIIDEEGKTVRETEDREYKDDGTIIWQLYPLEIDLKGLEPGKSYRCYPVLHYHDWYKLRATPSYEFTVPEPVSVKRSSLSIKKGDTKDITVSGGWGCYEIINDKNNIVTAYFSDEGEVTNSGDSNNSNESGGGGGGGYDWGPSLIWTSSWPTDETPTLHIKGTDVGETTVQVKDMRSNETTSIKVVVTDEEITSLELSSTSLALSVGKDGSVDITSGSGEYTAESSNTDIATVTINNGSIKVTAIAVGTATITVTDTETGQTASVEVTIKEETPDDGEKEPYAVLEDGVLTFYYDSQKDSRDGISFYQYYENYGERHNDILSIKSVVFDVSFTSCTSITSTRCWFSGWENLETITGIEYLNTSNVTDMSYMFQNCSSLTSLDLSHFDTKNVWDMSGMFCGCYHLSSLDLSHFDTRNVGDMSLMFRDCGLTNLDLSHFDTSNVTSMNYMFGGCSSLTNLDLSHFDTRNVGDMSLMFRDCGLKNLDLSHFNTSNVTSMNYMFMGCSSLTNLDLSHFDTNNVTSMPDMFNSCEQLETIFCGEEWTMTQVTRSSDMFWGCTRLVGGMGTRYDENHTDGEYARIDGGPERPGYFTDANAVAVEIKVEPQSIDFGTMTNGSSKTDYFTVSNTGEGTLIFHLDYDTLDGIFNVLEGGGETVLASGESKKYTVTCTIPENYEFYGGGIAVYILSNASNAESIRINLGVNVTHEEKTDVPAEAVDLGLPSGTLWASYNVGATKPEEVGGYYAWGETEEKDEYEWSNYSLCDGTEGTCSNIGEDIGGTQYDVAHVKWGPTWRMPTVTEWEEVIMNCSNQSFTMNGVNGILLTSRNNGNSIFIPVTGCRWDTGIYYGDNVYCWLSEQSSKGDDFANYLQYRNGMIGNGRDFERYIGLPVRPVYDGSWGKPSDGGDNGPHGNDDDGL